MRRRNPASITAMSRLAVPLFLRETDVKDLLTMDTTLLALEAAFREWAAGSQSPTQVLAVAAVRPLREVRVFSRTSAHRDALVEQLRVMLPGTIAIQPAGSLREAVDGASILTTITSAAHPIFPGEWLQAGQHLNVCGSNYPDRREIDGRGR